MRAQLERAEQLPAVRSDLKKGKALEWLVEHAEVVDEDGRPVDRALLQPPQPDEDALPARDDPASDIDAEEPSA